MVAIKLDATCFICHFLIRLESNLLVLLRGETMIRLDFRYYTVFGSEVSILKSLLRQFASLLSLLLHISDKFRLITIYIFHNFLKKSILWGSFVGHFYLLKIYDFMNLSFLSKGYLPFSIYHCKKMFHFTVSF